MIEPEQLADALERLDPRERELLALSLRRRVPDEALARVYDVDSQEVARRRAGAIERLADELGAQRGEDLGVVLQTLLDEGTWTAVEAGQAEGGQTPSVGETEILPEGDGAATAVEAPEAPESESTNGSPPVVAVASEPVLEMLAAREGLQGADGQAATEAPRRRRLPYLVILASFVAAVLGGAAALVGSSEWGDQGGTNSLRGSGDGTRHFVPQQGGPLAAPFPSEPQSISCYSTALVNGPTTLYREPGGRVRITLRSEPSGARPRVLGVVQPARRLARRAGIGAQERRGRLAAHAAAPGSTACPGRSTPTSPSGCSTCATTGKVVRKLQVAIGRRGNPTPKGRFTVTDKLRVTDPGSPYGCCVLALTGHQNRPAAGLAGRRPAGHPRDQRRALEHRQAGEPRLHARRRRSRRAG